MAKSISSRMDFLVKFGILPAQAYDFVFPHGIKLSVATKEYAMAGVVRDIAKNLADKTMQARLFTAGRSMVDYASKGLTAGWEDGDDICPPWPPFPWPGPYPGTGPDPLPWYSRKEGIDEYASALKVIAGLSAVPSAAKLMNEIAAALTKQSMGG